MPRYSVMNFLTSNTHTHAYCIGIKVREVFQGKVSSESIMHKLIKNNNSEVISSDFEGLTLVQIRTATI